jgi:hypothetical protein
MENRIMKKAICLHDSVLHDSVVVLLCLHAALRFAYSTQPDKFIAGGLSAPPSCYDDPSGEVSS